MLGELRRQTWQDGTADEKSMAFTYDVLGRKTGRTDDPAVGSNVSYTWTWDTVKQGLLTSQSGNGLTETYAYDIKSRLQTLTTTITGLSGSRVFSYTYDAFSRPLTVTYPDALEIEHQYHAAGLKARTRDTTGTPKILWALGEGSDNRGHLYRELLGNGVMTEHTYTESSGRIGRIQSGRLLGNGIAGFSGNVQDLEYAFDTLGNLYERNTGRTDLNGDPLEYTEESFTYDDLNRLTTSYTNWVGLGTRNRSYGYDALGNLTSRTGVGTLSYAQTGNAGVHAVTSAISQSYSYDEYGNLTQRGSETLDYDVFKKPTRIDTTYFSYGPDHQRYKQVDGSRTTYYINGGLYEEIVEGSTTKKSYVGGYLVHATTGSNVEGTYLHKDHLGSVDAMTDPDGNFIDRMSFDPWGERQLADWATGDPANGDPDHYPTTRGFTGHEHLEQVDLIHMNGRVYDPVIGRFMSADLLVTHPFNTQSFNRYSYVLNTPLRYTDPSGYNDYGGAAGIEEVVVKGRKPEPMTPQEMATSAIDNGNQMALFQAKFVAAAYLYLSMGGGPAGGNFSAMLANSTGGAVGNAGGNTNNQESFNNSIIESNQDRIRRLEYQARQPGSVGDLARIELAKIRNGGTLPSPQTEALAEVYGKVYGSLALAAAGGAEAEAAVHMARAGAVAAEETAVRVSVFMLDPKGGFLKGFSVGFTKGFGGLPVEIPPINYSFDKGASLGEFAGTVVGSVSSTLFGFP